MIFVGGKEVQKFQYLFVVSVFMPLQAVIGGAYSFFFE